MAAVAAAQDRRKYMKSIGTVVRGIRTPIIKSGDDLESIVVDSLLNAQKEEGFEFRDKDIIGITEAVVGIATSNYATVDDIATDIRNKYPDGNIGLVFPILSRNRFALILKGIARGAKKLTLLLSYPSDEVGNDILDKEKLNNYDVKNGVITYQEYKNNFNDFKHLFTGINMVNFYKDLVTEENCEIDFVFSNNPRAIIEYTKNILVCDIHSRFSTFDALKNKVNQIYKLTDILSESINGSGFNKEYGLLGSNRATEEKLKLFPNNCQHIVDNIQNKLLEKTGKKIEALVYGDGAFKDPIGGIWELADPVVSPFYTDGLKGSPNELKLKYLADNKFDHLSGDELNNKIKEEIKNKNSNLKGTIETQGTTPRRYIDLIGSLCDLTSGSGDKGTPVVYISGYFDNYAD